MSYIGKSPTGTGVRQRYYFTATGGETSLSGADDNGVILIFTDGAYVDVYLNGVLLVAGTDYNTTTKNTIGSLAALAASDIVEIIVYDVFTLPDAVKASTGGTFSAGVNVLGNVGIGTSSPLGKFMVKDGTSSPSALVVRQTSEAGAAALSLDSIFNNASNTDKEVASIKLGVITNGSGSPNADIRFETVGSGTLAERMRITSGGNVGIGTTSPSTLLHLSSTSPRITLTDTNTGADHRINADSGVGNLAFDIDINSETASPSAVFNIKGTERMRIDSAGTVTATAFVGDGSGLTGLGGGEGGSKAWAAFEQAGTHSFRDSFNFSSLSDIGTGQTRFSFTSNMANANYATTGCSGEQSGGGNRVMGIKGNSAAPATTGFDIANFALSSHAASDDTRLSVSVLGDQ